MRELQKNMYNECNLEKYDFALEIARGIFEEKSDFNRIVLKIY